MYVSATDRPMTELQKLVKDIAELVKAATKFAPNAAARHAFDALGREDGKPRVYTVDVNDEPITDHDYMRLHNALEKFVEKK